MACDTGRCVGKDAKTCPACGGDVPPSLGSKPRTYCSTRCSRDVRLGLHTRRRQQSTCAKCGAPVDYPGRGPRSGIHCRECRESYSRPVTLLNLACVRCGESFESPHRRRFCSRRCQYDAKGDIHGDLVPCARCSSPFKATKKRSSFCSRKCAMAGRKYQCLCCGVTFRRKRYASGAYSKQKKYCSRDCAFDARRRKLRCAVRPLELAGQLAGWFLGWNKEATAPPKRQTISCLRCGEVAVVKFGSDKNLCELCKSVRPCDGCGREIKAGRRRCGQCSKDHKTVSRREDRRRRRLLYGHDGTFRQRCKKYGAPYTKVSKKVVMDRAGWRCQICEQELLRAYTVLPGTRTPHNRCPTIDHISPLSLGPNGPGHVLDNCQAACWRCNCLRGAEPLDSFVQRKATSLDY